MVEEQTDPPKRVVKKVVKRTVAAPTQSTPERSVRAARLTTRTRPEVTRRAAPPVPPRKARTTPQPRTVTNPAAAPKGPNAPKRSFKPSMPSMPSIRRPSMPSVPRTSMPKPDVRGAFHAVGDWFVLGLHRIRDAITDAWHWLIDLRLPHLPPRQGSAITGAVVGFLAVGLGWGFYALFSATLGTQAGGRWGFLALVFVGFLGFIAGELLLSGFGVPHSRSVSILSILLVFVAILVFFLDLAAGIWAVLIVPTLCVLAYMASSSVMMLASMQSNDQRIPWEPTDDSTVT